MSDPLIERIHRTWLQVLIDTKHREIAALLVDAELSLEWSNWHPYVQIDLPSSAHSIIHNDKSIQDVISRSLTYVGRGYITDQNGNALDSFSIEYRLRLVEPEDSWRAVVRNLIVNAKDPNQGAITEKVFARDGKEPYLYNEMKFGSQSEIRIAQELEQRKVLFFPLPLAVRAETGKSYLDHREADFLVCDNGVWGILEVAYHPNRFEQDAEKDLWFKKSGILCVQHFTAERCHSQPRQVVEEFLSVLAKHRR
jgi:hypothetical protein